MRTNNDACYQPTLCLMTIVKFDDLKDFILDPQRMRMSHLYKPLMMITVLRNGGAASRDEIAADFIGRDVFQLEHYRRNVVDKMPGVRLVRDGVLERQGDVYRLAAPFRGLSESKQIELIAACEQRIEDFIAQRGDPFAGRNIEALPVGVRYEALKRVGGRCELCGVSHEEVALVFATSYSGRVVKSLIWCRYLVAGVGFEPTTFRL